MAKLINGKELAQKIRKELRQEVEELKEKGIEPKLAVIMIGENKASKVYVKNKSKACDEIGIKYEEFLLPEDAKMEELLDVIRVLNERKDVHAILLQSPIPSNLNIKKAFCAIDPKKYIDGFHPINIGKLSMGEDCFVSCTPYRSNKNA